MRFIPMRVEQRADVVVAGASQHRGATDLVSVELQDREDGAVANGIEKAHALPGPFEGTGLCLTVSDDARHQEVGIVEGRAERVDQGVPEFATLVGGAWRLD